MFLHSCVRFSLFRSPYFHLSFSLSAHLSTLYSYLLFYLKSHFFLSLFSFLGFSLPILHPFFITLILCFISFYPDLSFLFRSITDYSKVLNKLIYFMSFFSYPPHLIPYPPPPYHTFGFTAM